MAILESVDRARLFAATLKARQLADFIRPTRDADIAVEIDYLCDAAMTLQARIEGANVDARAAVPDAAPTLCVECNEVEVLGKPEHRVLCMDCAYETGRAAVPDAATEAERDAALAAIERMRAIHKVKHGEKPRYAADDYRAEREPVAGEKYSMCEGCSATWPCRTIAALDGAPEPDREAQLERVAARLRKVVYLCGDDLGCQCEEAQDASDYLARELSIIAAERPTLTADEVWAIARAEHDFAGDSDNVGAFVDSLTDALRTAGVAFDEQQFIDSGYLLPVEGEKP